jgi:deoxycytidylate deaminase
MSDPGLLSVGLQDIVIGLVAPIGTDLDPVCRALASSFQRLGYSAHQVRLSEHLDEVQSAFGLKLKHTDEADRYDKYMTAGNCFRTALKRGDALSMLAVGAIREFRKTAEGTKQAFILRSLKHPDEVQSLRNIYGPAFVLFSLASSRTARVQHLARKICKSHQEFDASKYLPAAEQLINRDQQEPHDPMGQKVSKVFHLADFFIDVDHGMEEAVKRLVELFLGNVFITPTRSEQGMFLAHASAWRSASLQRQVGAVIATSGGDVIATGTNEAAKPGGGLYWEGDNPDFRDFQRGGEINDDMKHRMLVEVVQRLLKSGMCHQKNDDGTDHVLAKETDAQKVVEWMIKNQHMDNTRILSVLEFGRCVHAEMAALMDAARRGAAVDGSSLFSTTFPCHECARHIVAAGIKKVYYIEPYPKSLVNELYPDSIRIEGEECGGFVSFVPFVGVAPRRYQDVFRLGDIDRKSFVAYAHDWKPEVANPRLGEYPSRTQKINMVAEEAALEEFSTHFESVKNGIHQTGTGLAGSSNAGSSG